MPLLTFSRIEGARGRLHVFVDLEVPALVAQALQRFRSDVGRGEDAEGHAFTEKNEGPNPSARPEGAIQLRANANSVIRC